MASRVYGTFAVDAPGGESSDNPVLSITGNFPLGVAPGSFTVEVAAPFIGRDGTPRPSARSGVTTALSTPGAFLDLFTPETPKRITIGDEVSGCVTFKNMWINTVDGNEVQETNAVHTVTLQDRRVWWHRRGEMGSKVWNSEMFGEWPGVVGDNERYSGARARTVEEMFKEIFAFLGETNVKLRGEDGFSDIREILIEGAGLHQHTPPFVINAGETPVAALMRLSSLYDLIPAISPDDSKCGLISRGMLTDRLDDVYGDLIKKGRGGATPQHGCAVGGTWSPLNGMGTGYDRESLPDVLMIKGSPILIGDHLVLEAVCEDPDRRGTWIPLDQVATLEAYGIDFDAPGYQSFNSNGEHCGRLAIGLAASVADGRSSHLPFSDLMETWFQHWRVAMPQQTITDAWEGGQPGTTARTQREEEWTDGRGNTRIRIRSPRYQLIREDGGLADVTTGTRSLVTGKTVWEPKDFHRVAEPHRWLPIFPHTAFRGRDGQMSDLKVKGVNVILPIQQDSKEGDQGSDWKVVGPIAIQPERENIEDNYSLSHNVTVVDANAGVIALSAPVYGHSGKAKSGGKAAIHGQIEGQGTEGRTLMDLINAEIICNRGPVAADEGAEEEESDPLDCEKAELGIPYLNLHCSFLKESHCDERDFTSTYSSGSPHRTAPDSQLGSLVLPGLLKNIMNGDAPAEVLIEEPSGDRSNAYEIWVKSFRGIQLRCYTSRVARGRDWILSPSFYRDGGYNSGRLTGTCTFFDKELVKLSDLISTYGTFTPISQKHYSDIWEVWSSIIIQLSDSITKFRSSGKNIRVINADLEGCHRQYMPGVVEFADTPADAVSVTGSGDASSATMRISVNSRGWRPFVGSSIERQATASINARAAGMPGFADSVGSN